MFAPWHYAENYRSRWVIALSIPTLSNLSLSALFTVRGHNARGRAGKFAFLSGHAPQWFFRFANSNVLFAAIPTVFVVLLWVGLRMVVRRVAGRETSTDLDMGLELVMAAIVALPGATTLRVAKELHGASGTSPRSTIAIAGAILAALVLLAVVLARAAGRSRSRALDESPSFADLVFGVFVPNLAGIFSVLLVLLFASRGGTLHP